MRDCKTSLHSAGLELLLHQVLVARLRSDATFGAPPCWAQAHSAESRRQRACFCSLLEDSRWTFTLDLETLRLCLLTDCVGDRAVPQTVAW